ncbi:MAG: phosphate signaling complex protein PhoU [Paracoccaceae bacterium]
MSEQHISRAFDRDLDAIQALVMKMGGMVELAIAEASNALEAGNEDLAEKVRQSDKEIDALEHQINEDAARLIALRAPAATDLRVVLSVIKIASALERIGDYAKNMAKRTQALGQLGSPEVIKGAGASLRRMAKSVSQMISDALDAYAGRHLDLAQDVRARDKEIDQMYNALFREFLTHMMEDPRNITACMHLHFIAKNTERMGDHATAIAEQVVYLITGEIPDAPRPKADNVTMSDTA